ncbi:MAG: hypothetical protein OEX18_12270 [Candidatus Krumholzibacteria bacterium]|nr:hypothetical protein [Candidatus Krumholzibacteria bacterium]MDH4338039.1 hypothetical protein [Candidatus Krumholzibacteria bacterium]MDH5269390.1 hypothetical protein [Candidatus Krumholzibacteria bacterium]MDH5627080.1 hypothetical protein [Candidatus Krumholzibacteria bacterium]
MATRSFSESVRVRSPGVYGRIAGTSRNVRATLLGIVLVVAALVFLSVERGQRVAEWAPLDVVSSRDPLQELPIRIAGKDGVVRPARTHDAVLDMKRIPALVVGVDLDRIAPAPGGNAVVIRNDKGDERFRDTIDAHYFDDGRFMLKLFAGQFPPGVYWLEIEALSEGGDARVVAASWFEVLR